MPHSLLRFQSFSSQQPVLEFWSSAVKIKFLSIVPRICCLKKKSLKCLFASSILAWSSFLKQSQRLQTALLNNIIWDPCPHPHPCCYPPPIPFPISLGRNKFLFPHRTLQLICHFPFHLLKWSSSLPLHAQHVSLKTGPLVSWGVSCQMDSTIRSAPMQFWERKYEMQRQGFLYRVLSFGLSCAINVVLWPFGSWTIFCCC